MGKYGEKDKMEILEDLIDDFGVSEITDSLQQIFYEKAVISSYQDEYLASLWRKAAKEMSKLRIPVELG